jgi:hypothetical protein
VRKTGRPSAKGREGRGRRGADVDGLKTKSIAWWEAARRRVGHHEEAHRRGGLRNFSVGIEEGDEGGWMMLTLDVVRHASRVLNNRGERVYDVVSRLKIGGRTN